MFRLKPFFSYYGSKWRLAKFYTQPIYKTIIEPFAGSAQYSLLHYGKNIVLYDDYEVIVQLWNYLINVSECEINNLPLLSSGEKIPGHLSEEAKILIGFWVSSACVSPRNKQSSYESINKGNFLELGYWGPKIRHRISTQLKYIRHWKIYKNTYKNIVNIPATYFIDPPYQVGGDRYIHSNIDYNYLANWCKSRKGEVIVCENDNAKWLEFEPLTSIKGMRKTTREVFYYQINYTEYMGIKL